MTLAAFVAALMFLGVIFYAVLGGADFGSGVWDLLAGDARRGARLRSLIDHSIGPVWEANHVWLIYVLVIMWTAFPEPFVALVTTLEVPLILAGGGIVLRGAGFAFRKFAATVDEARVFGAAFAASSVVTPFFFGTVAGAVASGRVPAEGNGDAWTSWTGPTSIAGGVLAVLVCAFLAATFLAADADRAGDRRLADAMGTRAWFSGFLAGAAALAAAATLEFDAPTLVARLHRQGLAPIVVSAVAGVLALVDLRAGRYARARLAAVAAVLAVVVGWGVAQYPWLLVDEVTIDAGAGARATLIGIVVVVGLAVVIVFPPLIYLFLLTQREEWSAAEELESADVGSR